MKRTLLLALAVVAVASLSFAQQPWIGLYTDDPGYSDCNLEDTAPGLCAVYMVQGGHSAISAEFRIDNTNSGGILNTGINWNVPVAIIPSGETLFSAGASLGYGACLVSPVKLGTLNYFCQGTTPACSSLDVVAHAQTGEATIADCTLPSPVVIIATTLKLTINGDVSCPCGVPVETTSWGQIKALYSE